MAAPATTHTMPKRRLGNSNLMVSSLGLGIMGMTAYYSKDSLPEDQAISTIHTAIREGVNFFDTAAVYSFGKNEELLGKAIKGRREGLVIATKFGIELVAPGQIGLNSKPDAVKKACEASLKALGIDCIDLYYQHRVDKATPIEETVKAMAELVKEGKVRYLGLSEASVETIRRAHKVHPITAVQIEYSLWTRDHEFNDVIKTCRELDIAIVAYSPVGRGFLTGQIKSPDDIPKDDWRATNPRFMGENFQNNLKLVAKIEEVAKAKGCTPSQLALAWVLAQGNDIIPIPGTKREKFLLENNASVHLKLTDAEKAQLEDCGKMVTGDRYVASSMSSLNG